MQMIPQSELEKILEARRKFLLALTDFGQHLEQRIGQLKELLEYSAGSNESKRELYRSLWQPRLNECVAEARQFRRLAEVRPTACVMGKRGQGKTTLLKRWLGKEAPGDLGLEEFRKLPTGDTDTTAALIRLTASRKGNAAYDSNFLHVDLISPDELADVAERPAHLPINQFQLQRQIHDPDVSPTAAFNICRFPSAGTSKDEELRLTSNGGAYQVSREGEQSFSSAQWTAKQVRIPVNIGSTAEHGHASRILNSLDIIDAPGADSQAQGKLPQWKAAKNAYVFKAAINEIDVLILVCSSDVAAIQLGGQFQRDIWIPWVDRCKSEGAGRLVMAFTHASIFLKDAQAAIERQRSTEEGQDYYYDSNSDTNFAKKLWVNALDPLAIRTPNRDPIISQINPETWPPIFFFDAHDSELAQFREGITPGGSQEVADKLCALLDEHPSTAAESEKDLPLGQQCILYLAREWDRFSQGTTDSIHPVKHWITRAFCALLDTQDRGFKLLTDCICSYTSIGPVAKNHAKERNDGALLLYRKFRSLLDQIGAPSNRENAVRELSDIRELLKVYWQKYPNGPQLQLGNHCARRLEMAKQNASPLRELIQEFSINEIIADVVDDCISQLPIQEMAWDKGQTTMIRTAMVFCLEHDNPMVNLHKQHSNSITRLEEPLRRYQAAGMERLVRILHYLGHASSEQLRLVATHCYRANVDEAELVAAAIARGLFIETESDLFHVECVSQAHEHLTTLIHGSPFLAPYAHPAGESKKTTPSPPQAEASIGGAAGELPK